MKRERKPKKFNHRKNKIFSPKNLLIGFFFIIIFLLTFNYFNPFFSEKNKSFYNEINYGELYSQTSSEPEPEPRPASDGKTDPCYKITCSQCRECKADGKIARCVARAPVPGSSPPSCKIKVNLFFPPIPGFYKEIPGFCKNGWCFAR